MAKTTLRIPEELRKRLKIRAVEDGRDMQDLAAEALERYLLVETGKGRRGTK